MADFQDRSRRNGYYGAYGNVRAGWSTAILEEKTAKALAQKYDVSHISRNEYSLLLCDLRNLGIITTKEFSVGYGGTIPHDVHGSSKPGLSELFPLGENRANFIELLKEYAQYCSQFLGTSDQTGIDQDHVQSLSLTYSRLYELFSQIQTSKA